MKFLVLSFVFFTALAARAEVYTETGSVWSTRCYEDNLSSEAYQNLKDDALNDACETAKQTCLEQHSAKHPAAVFHCEIESSTLQYGVQNYTRLKDGTYCPYTNEGMDGAQYSCTVEVVPGAE